MKIFRKLLTMIIAIALIALPAYAAEAAKGSTENPYKWKEIPASWIKQAKKDGTLKGYTITVADGKMASFKLSGSQFKEYSVKGEDGKYGKAVALNDGKFRTVKDISVIRVILRSPVENPNSQNGQQAQPNPPNGQKEVKTGDLPVGTVLPGGVVVVDKIPEAGW